MYQEVEQLGGVMVQPEGVAVGTLRVSVNNLVLKQINMRQLVDKHCNFREKAVVASCRGLT